MRSSRTSASASRCRWPTTLGWSAMPSIGERRSSPSRPRPRSAAAFASWSALLARTGLQRAGSRPALQAQYVTLRARVHTMLVEELVEVENASEEVVVAKIAELVNQVAAEMTLTLTRQDKQRIVEALVNDVLGLGPLEALLSDPEITEVMINGPKQIYVEQHGKITRSNTEFENNEQLLQVIDRIVSTVGRRVDESS